MHQLIEIDDYIPQALRTESDYAKADLFLLNKENQRLLHASMGLCTEGGEIQDHIKRAIFYGKPLDLKHLKEEAGDVFWYLAILCSVLKVDPREVLAMNIAKLKARFPDKFDAEKAVNRDLEAESKAIESQEQHIYTYSVNGMTWNTHFDQIEYEVVCMLAHIDPKLTPSVTVRGKNVSRTLCPREVIKLVKDDKFHFECIETGNA